MFLRLAARNLGRHRWRTLLTISGIAISTALLIALISLLTGFYDQMARGATSLDFGQIQLQSREYRERASLHHSFSLSPERMEALSRADGVEALAPRLLASGLVGHEDQSRIARIRGVDPLGEAQVTGLEGALLAGEWLSPTEPAPDEPREAILGSIMAEILDVSVGDELVVLLQAADGSLGNDLLEIRGIIHTGNLQIDRQTIYMHLEDLRFLTAMEEELHEILFASGLDEAPGIARRIRETALTEEEARHLEVRPWQEVASELYLMMELADQVTIWLLFIVFIIAALGVFNALRMSTLERSQEFGVMLGVGLSNSRLGRIIVLEGALIGLAGALLGGLLGSALTLFVGTRGMNLAIFTDQGTLSLMGFHFSDRIYFDLSLGAFLAPVLGILIVTLLCSFWPAFSAMRQEPRDAIAGR